MARVTLVVTAMCVAIATLTCSPARSESVKLDNYEWFPFPVVIHICAAGLSRTSFSQTGDIQYSYQGGETFEASLNDSELDYLAEVLNEPAYVRAVHDSPGSQGAKVCGIFNSYVVVGHGPLLQRSRLQFDQVGELLEFIDRMSVKYFGSAYVELQVRLDQQAAPASEEVP